MKARTNKKHGSAWLRALAGLPGAVGLGLWALYKAAFRSPNKVQDDPFNIPSGEQYQAERERMRNMIARLLKEPWEPVYIESFDGLKLHGQFYLRDPKAPLAIGCHGYRGNPARDFSGGAMIALDMGMNLLLIDERAHGKSEGHTITLGAKEQKDISRWLKWGEDWAKEVGDPEKPIFLYGVSMGAASVLMAAGGEVPKTLAGVIADSPYSSAKDIVMQLAKDAHLPRKPVFWIVWLAEKLFGGADLREADAVKAAAQIKVPVMILHGLEDHFVHDSLSVKIQSANPELIRRYTFEGAGHGLSFIVDEPRYRRLTEAFTKECLERINH